MSGWKLLSIVGVGGLGSLVFLSMVADEMLRAKTDLEQRLEEWKLRQADNHHQQREQAEEESVLEVEPITVEPLTAGGESATDPHQATTPDPAGDEPEA